MANPGVGGPIRFCSAMAGRILVIALLSLAAASGRPVTEDEIKFRPPPRRWIGPLVVGLACLAIAAWLCYRDHVRERAAHLEHCISDAHQDAAPAKTRRGVLRDGKDTRGQELGAVKPTGARRDCRRTCPAPSADEEPWYAREEWYVGADAKGDRTRDCNDVFNMGVPIGSGGASNPECSTKLLGSSESRAALSDAAIVAEQRDGIAAQLSRPFVPVQVDQRGDEEVTVIYEV